MRGPISARAVITPSFLKSFITPMRQTAAQAPAINRTARSSQLDIFLKKTNQSGTRAAASARPSVHLLHLHLQRPHHHAARGWITREARRAGGALLRAGRRHAGLPGAGARAGPLRPLFPGAALAVSAGGARMRRGAAGARLRMLPRLRAAGRRAVRDLHGAVRLRLEVQPESGRPPAPARPHPRTGAVHGRHGAPVHPRASADAR